MIVRHGVVVGFAALATVASGCSALTGSASDSPAPPPPTTLAQLSERIRTGTSSTASAALSMSITADRQQLTATGGETLHDGVLTSFTVDEKLPDGSSISIRTVDGRTYLKLPAPLSNPDQPWVVVDSSSRNPVAQALATDVAQVQSATGMVDVTKLTAAAAVLHNAGDTKINGDLATQYTFTLALDQLPTTFPGGDVLRQAGVTAIPVQFWVDAQYRPVQLREQLSVGGDTATVLIGFSAYDLPMTIKAPPADQIAPA